MQKSDNLYKAFLQQKSNAEDRGIPFLLSYEEWLKFWQDSGHLPDRGKRANQYCMARYGDIGPYVLGNIKIITNSENCSEGSSYTRSAVTKHRMHLAMKGRVRTAEHQKNLTASLQNKPPVTKETGDKISAALKGKKRKPFTTEHLERLAEATRRSVATKKSAGTYVNPGRFRKAEVEKKGMPKCIDKN